MLLHDSMLNNELTSSSAVAQRVGLENKKKKRNNIFSRQKHKLSCVLARIQEIVLYIFRFSKKLYKQKRLGER